MALRQQLKRQMRVFPAAPCFVDPLRKQKALVPSAPLEPCIEELAHGVVHLGNAGTLAISSTRCVTALSVRFHLQVYAGHLRFRSIMFLCKVTHYLILQVAEIEKRSIPADESPFLLSAAAGVSHAHVFKLERNILMFLFCFFQ